MKYNLSKTSERGRLIKNCDKLFREIILLERPNKCEWCGRAIRLQIAHIISKAAHPRLRFKKENVLLLCFPCHPPKWHKKPHEAMDYVRKYKGEKHLEKLYEIERWAGRHDRLYLMALEMNFRNELEGLKKG